MPQIYTVTPPLDLEVLGDSQSADLGHCDLMRIQLKLDSGTWPTGAEITAYMTLDGEDLYVLDAVVEFTDDGLTYVTLSPPTFTKVGITKAIDLAALGRVFFNVTTDQSGTPGTVVVHVQATSSQLNEIAWRNATGGAS